MVLPLHSPEDKITSGNIPSFRIPMGIPYGCEELTNLGPWISCPTWLFWHGTDRKWLSSHVAKNIASFFSSILPKPVSFVALQRLFFGPKRRTTLLSSEGPLLCRVPRFGELCSRWPGSSHAPTLSASANPFKFRLPQSLLDTAWQNKANSSLSVKKAC